MGGEWIGLSGISDPVGIAAGMPMRWPVARLPGGSWGLLKGWRKDVCEEHF
jgi:hypothetical protein